MLGRRGGRVMRIEVKFGHRLALLLRCRGSAANLLVVGGDCRDLLTVKVLCEQRHRLRTVSAETALPRSQLERGAGRIMSRYSCDDLDVLAVLKCAQREEPPKIQAKVFNAVARGDVLCGCGGGVMPV